jgi:membrane protein
LNRAVASPLTRRRVTRAWEITRVVATAAAENKLLTYASALAFRALVSLIPLTLLGVALLGVFGLTDVWTDSVAPAIEGHLTKPVFEAIDFSVQKIFSSEGAGLIAFALLLLTWNMTWAVRTIMEALNAIHDVDEARPLWRRVLLAIGLGIAVGVCVVGSFLVVTAAPRLGADGTLDYLLVAGRWIVAIALLALAVGVLMRYAPAERPEPRWASAGSVLVIVVWIGASLLFGWYVSSLANFETAVGNLTVLLVLTAYVFTSSAIFFVGAQLDEFLRMEQKRTKRR